MKAMGIRLAGRANNHTGDNKDDGMFSTDALLDEAGIVHAGTGRNLEEARDAAYVMTPKGRVGLVALMPISDNAPGGDNQGPSFARTAARSHHRDSRSRKSEAVTRATEPRPGWRRGSRPTRRGGRPVAGCSDR